ncbi:MAG: biotin transporter BioY [Sneathiella sp.]|uniref:biotin transporter BioY n=1 Tax=Sneathiella sp. TaxID=1964365 RepID=UPI000C35A7B7|nr:biotin transporter BioY [Sneathiella sp.]MAZ04259.1 biotin transporter BioY [Sneathiella sp.]
MSVGSTSSPLIDSLWTANAEASRSAKLFRLAILALAGSMIIAISAQIAVPMWPVPMTMQTLAVTMIGATYGWRLGGATVALYLAEGAMGLPVFAGGGSLASLAGPTAGYLFAFVAAAALVGALMEKGWGQSIFKTTLAMVVGYVVIFGGGVSWLSSFIGIEKALAAGLYPFMAGAAVKIALAVALLPMVGKLVEKLRK